MTNSVLARLAVVISANTAEFTKSINTTQNSLNRFTSNITKLSSIVGVAFSVQQVSSFAFEISKLAGEADGVERAFQRLPNATRLLEEMKEATGGTVSELGLMKRAVQASNFDISLSALPRLLEFATLRAQQTGQSVDYLVDSIVTGIGRKSKLILDNLGISAVQLNEALGGVSTGVASIGDVADAVGKIAEDNLTKMAGFAENASTKTQRLAAEWENFKVELGRGSNNVSLMNEGLDALILTLKNLTTFLDSDGATGLWNYLRLVTLVPRKTLEAANAALEYANSLNSLETAVDDFNNKFGNRPFAGVFEDTKEFNDALGHMAFLADKDGKKIKLLRDEMGNVMAVIKPFTNTITTLTEEEDLHIDNLEYLKNQLEELNALFEQTDRNDKEKLKSTGAQIIAINKQIEALEKLRKAEKEKDPLAGKFQFLPDIEAEGSTNPDLRNEQAAVDAREFAAALGEVATSAQFANGAVIQLDQTTSDSTDNMKRMWFDLSGVVENAAAGIGQALGSALNGTQNLGDGLLRVLGGVLVQLGEMLLTAGIGIEAFKTSLESLNGAVAIAAGIALIALGTAVAGSIKGLGSNPSGGSSRSSFSGRASNFTRGGTEINVGGEFRIQGQDLIYIINRQNQLNGRTSG